MQTTTVSFFTCMLLLCSCSKDGQQYAHRSITPTTENLVGSYSLVGLSLTDNAGVQKDLFAGMKPCLQDNVYAFKSNGSYYYSDAGILCDPTRSESASWKLQQDASLRVGFTVYQIEQFNALGMALSSDSTIDGRLYKMTRKFLRH